MLAGQIFCLLCLSWCHYHVFHWGYWVLDFYTCIIYKFSGNFSFQANFGLTNMIGNNSLGHVRGVKTKVTAEQWCHQFSCIFFVCGTDCCRKTCISLTKLYTCSFKVTWLLQRLTNSWRERYHRKPLKNSGSVRETNLNASKYAELMHIAVQC